MLGRHNLVAACYFIVPRFLYTLATVQQSNPQQLRWPCCPFLSLQNQVPFLYLKPVQTGFPADSDARLVAAAAQAAEEYGPHAAALLDLGQQQQANGSAGGGRPEWWLTARTLYAWSRPLSPHRAVELEGEGLAYVSS